ncbi:PREDICTED: immunoglobulin superfamily member 2-like, partial [Nanorana parkeri]|uniref:immunoglobulin superfamily member 2-like n=1 Tax=Nanorana parkeri TaxID=125878 RepID=UPI000854748F
LSHAQNEVTIEQGPLYRTVGSDITIWCKETGYRGASDLEFQYLVRLQSAPALEINVVSSDDPNFSYAKYSQRVLSGNINVERVTRTHTVLHIINVQEGDTGEYECYTPNTAATFQGTYSAKTNLTVIPNTLQVSMAPQTVTKSEGASLELTCQVSMASSQHTHLSVSWILSTDSDAEILTLTRDFVLHPGGAFSERFTAGDIRLDKLSESSYKLTIGALHQSDQGEIFCRGSEWIQDPSGAWTKIAEKDSEKTNVKVAAVQGGDFEVQVKASAEVLTPGRPLEVTCSVSNTSPSGGQFRVVWQLSGTMKAIWEPSGVVTFRSELSSAGAEGRLAVHRRDLTSWVLRISQVRIEDGGSYVCEVTDQRSKKRTSKPTSVEVKLPEFRTPEISLTAVPPQPYEGDSVAFHCRVSASSSSPASLGWFRRAVSGERTHVVSLLQDGRLEIGADYRQRHNEARLLAEKADSGLFVLRMDEVTQSDGGEYFCRYAEGTHDSNGDGTNVTTESNGVQTDIRRLDSTVKVSLMTRNSKPTLGSTASLYCHAKADFTLRDRRRLVWSWFFQPESDRQGPFQSLVQGPGNGELVWGDSYPSFKGKTQISLSANNSILQVHRVQRLQQSGTYRCAVTILAARSGVTLATVSSSDVTMKVQLPDTKLRLDSTSRALVLTTGQDEAAVTCKISERTPGTDLSVTWFFRPPSSASQVEVLRVDHGGVTIQDPSSRPRFMSRQSPADSFSLRILRPGLGDMGGFHCAVQEWLQEETGNWIQVGERISGDTQITFAASGGDPCLCVVSSVPPPGGDLCLCVVSSVPPPGGDLCLCVVSSVPPPGGDLCLCVVSSVPPPGGDLCLCVVSSVPPPGGDLCLCKVRHIPSAARYAISLPLPDTKLRLDSTSRALVLTTGQDEAAVTCKISERTPGTDLSVTWFFRPPSSASQVEVLRVDHGGVTIQDPSSRPRFMSRQSPADSFSLRILRPGLGDMGGFHCAVQEWLQEETGNWIQVGERISGDTQITFAASGGDPCLCVVSSVPPPGGDPCLCVVSSVPPAGGDLGRSVSVCCVLGSSSMAVPLQSRFIDGHTAASLDSSPIAHCTFFCLLPDQTLKLPKQNVSSSVKLEEDLVLPCPLEAEPSPSSLLSISWFRQGWDFSPPRLLYRSDRDGVTEYKDGRLRMVVPRRGNYSLVLQSAGRMDGGRYFCRVEEWRLQDGEWKMTASDQSGFLEISVTLPDRLSLNRTDLALLVPQQSTITLPCQVLAVSLPSSLLSISWWKAGGPVAPHTLLFAVNHAGEFTYPQEKKDRLQYERPSELTFH